MVSLNEILTNTYIDGRHLSKFTNILPPDINIYILKLKNIQMLYLSYNTIVFGSKHPDMNGLIGYIQFVIVKEEDEAVVLYIHTEEEYRGLGVSVFLFILMADVLYTLNINKVSLDDDSDQVWKKPNVYIKMGMNYIHSKPEPEMEGRVSNIRKKWDKQYFIKKGFFYKPHL